MNISEFRQSNPQFDNVSDEQLAKSLHQKYYNDVPYEQFAAKFGVASENAQPPEKAAPLPPAKVPAPREMMKQMIWGDNKDVTPVSALLTGFNTGVGNVAHGVAQPILENLMGDNIAQASKNVAAQRDAEYAKASAAHPFIAGAANVVGGIGATAPLMLIPGVGQSNLARIVTQGAAQGLGAGAAQYVPEGGSRLLNAAEGAALGATLPLGVIGAVQGTKALAQPAAYLAEKVAKRVFAGVDAKKTLEAKAAADRIGHFITPAEASGSPLAAAEQGRRGTSPQGALMMQAADDDKLESGKKVIQSLLDDLSPDNSSAADRIRGTAQNIVKTKEEIMKAKAAPYYEIAGKEEAPIPALNKIVAKDGNIEVAFNKVLNSKLYQLELSEAPPNSIKVWDLVRQDLKEQYEEALGKKRGTTSRILKNSLDSLTSILDDASPTYALARRIYSTDAKPLEKLKASTLGQIASLPDHRLKSVSRIIFDPSQTNTKVLAELRDQVVKTSPNAWRKIVRNEIERRLDLKKSEAVASNFYDAFLARDRDYKQLLLATEKLPDVRQKIVDMRIAFKHLINPMTANTSARLAKSSLDVPRSSIELAKNIVSNFLGGKYDQAAIKLMHSPDWDKELLKITKVANKTERAIQLGQLLGRIAATEGANINNKIMDERDNATQ